MPDSLPMPPPMTPMDNAANAYDAARKMLGLLEECLQPIVDGLEGSPTIEFVSVFDLRLRRVSCSVLAGETPDVRSLHAFERLFGELPDDDELDRARSTMEHAEATSALATFVEWVGRFEQKLSHLDTEALASMGMTAHVVGTVEHVGHALLLGRDDDACEPNRRLNEAIEICRTVALR